MYIADVRFQRILFAGELGALQGQIGRQTGVGKEAGREAGIKIQIKIES